MTLEQLEKEANKLGYGLIRFKTEDDWYTCGCGEYIQYKNEDAHIKICEG